MKIEIAKAKPLGMCILKSNDLAAHVLQRLHPIPIRRQPVESQRHAFRRRRIHIQRLVAKLRRHACAMRVDGPY